MAAFVMPQYANSIFAVINPKATVLETKNLMKHFGFEDSVVNHLLLLKDIKLNDYDDIDLERRSHTSILSKRFFTVHSIDNIESLTITFADIDIMKKDFRGSMREFIKR